MTRWMICVLSMALATTACVLEEETGPGDVGESAAVQVPAAYANWTYYDPSLLAQFAQDARNDGTSKCVYLQMYRRYYSNGQLLESKYQCPNYHPIGSSTPSPMVTAAYDAFTPYNVPFTNYGPTSNGASGHYYWERNSWWEVRATVLDGKSYQGCIDTRTWWGDNWPVVDTQLTHPGCRLYFRWYGANNNHYPD